MQMRKCCYISLRGTRLHSAAAGTKNKVVPKPNWWHRLHGFIQHAVCCVLHLEATEWLQPVSTLQHSVTKACIRKGKRYRDENRKGQLIFLFSFPRAPPVRYFKLTLRPTPILSQKRISWKYRERRLLILGMLRRVVSQKLTDVSEVFTAFSHVCFYGATRRNIPEDIFILTAVRTWNLTKKISIGLRLVQSWAHPTGTGPPPPAAGTVRQWVNLIRHQHPDYTGIMNKWNFTPRRCTP
jgi:hypothetical protein